MEEPLLPDRPVRPVGARQPLNWSVSPKSPEGRTPYERATGIKPNETKRNETKRNETKRNETKRNETKRNETKRNETKRNETNEPNDKGLIMPWLWLLPQGGLWSHSVRATLRNS
jgi:hypothetical protein